MKRKADINPYYNIEKKNSSLKIYDLHIQKAEGFYIKKLKSKYIFYNQTFVSDIIKSEKLYPRFIFRNIYYKDQLSIINQFNFEIIQNEGSSILHNNSNIIENKKDYKKTIINEPIREKSLISKNTDILQSMVSKKIFKNQQKVPEYIQNLEKNKDSIKINSSQNKSEINQKKICNNHIETNKNMDEKELDIINKDLKDAVYGEKNLLSKEIYIKEITKDGNCFYRSISFFLLNTEEFYLEIKNLIIDWINNNYKQYTEFFGDDETNNITKEEQAQNELEYIKKKDSWGTHYTIAIACLLFNIDIALYIKTDVNVYKCYYLFKIDKNENRELCIMEYQINYHFNLIYSKKKEPIGLYENIESININPSFKSSDINLNNKKLSFDYIETKFLGSNKFYDEFARFLLSIKENEEEIKILSKQNPNMHYNQILSYCKLNYPKRLEGNNPNISKKRQTFRNYLKTYKLNENNRLCIKNPLNKENESDVYYKIPFNHEKDLILLEAHNNYNHCGRESAYNNIISSNWYWYGITKDIQNYINSCPLCNNKGKFKKLKAKSKIIIENGPHYRYIADLWTIPKEISSETEYKYILDIVDHFSKWYYGYLLKSKSAEEVLINLENFCELFGYPKILQTDNGGEFKNKQLENFCEKNSIKLIHSSPYHPQTNGAVEVTHKEIQKYICFEFLKDKHNFNIQAALYNIIKIHNNKIHSTTKRIPRDIRDIDNTEEIEDIKSEIIKTLEKKNKNKNEIDFDKFYVIDENNIIVLNNKIIEIKRKKTKLNKKLLKKIPIRIISKCEEENYYLIEIKKNKEDFEEGNLYEIKIDLIEEVSEELWKKLLD